MAAPPRVGPRDDGMDWLTRLLAPRQAKEAARRDAQTRSTLSMMDTLLRELREEVQEAAADDRKGYPIENALHRRKSP